MNLQHERITTLCTELRLGGIGTDYPAAAQRAVEAASYPDFLETLLRAELDTRRARARNMLAEVAGFPAIKTLDQYDFEFATGAPRPQIMQLAGLGFVERAENVILLGPSGVGKTHLTMLRRPVEPGQYTSVAFGKRCGEAGVCPLMGSVGDAYDNAMAESFFSTLEAELLSRRRFVSQAEARMACFSYIEGWYKPYEAAFWPGLPFAHDLRSQPGNGRNLHVAHKSTNRPRDRGNLRSR